MSSEIEKEKMAARVREALDRQSCPDHFMRVAVEAILFTPPSSATPGEWVMVPREPTEAMCKAMANGYYAAQEGTAADDMVHAYDAMLAAAPQPQERAGSDAGAVAVGKLIRPHPPGAGVIRKVNSPNGATCIIPNDEALNLPPGEYDLYTHPQPASDASGGDVLLDVERRFLSVRDMLPSDYTTGYSEALAHVRAELATLSRALAESRGAK